MNIILHISQFSNCILYRRSCFVILPIAFYDKFVIELNETSFQMFEFLITFSPDSSASLAWKLMLHLLKQSSICPVNLDAFEIPEELRHGTGTSAKLLQMCTQKNSDEQIYLHCFSSSFLCAKFSWTDNSNCWYKVYIWVAVIWWLFRLFFQAINICLFKYAPVLAERRHT